jgi:hypothetical protein
MFKNKEFSEVYSEVESFNQLLETYSLNQKDCNEEMKINILFNYEKNLKNNFSRLFTCVQEKTSMKICTSDFKDAFIKLRSDTSLQIENINKNKTN